MKRALLLVAVAACSSTNNPLGGDDYPIVPTGSAPPVSQGSGSAVSDGGVDGGDGGTQRTGKVCIIDDLRNAGSAMCLNGTPGRAAGGLNVRLDGNVVLTAVDGTFSIPAPTSTDAVWKVDDGNADTIRTTFMPYAGQTLIPVLSEDGFIALESGSSFTLAAEGAGLVLVRVVRGAAAVAGVTGAVDAPSDAVALYDGDTATEWVNPATGSKGFVLFAGVAANPSGAATPASAKLKVGATTVPLTMTVWDQAITFLTKTVP